MRLGTLALTLCSAAQAQPSSAQVEPYRLTWVRERGAESCISGAALARLLQQVVGATESTTDSQTLLEGRIAPAEAPLRWKVSVRVSDAHGEIWGERELTNAEAPCSALTSSVLLILAMSIDPNAARDGLPPAVVEELRRDRAEDVDVWPASSAPVFVSPSAQDTPTAAPSTRQATPHAARDVRHPFFPGGGASPTGPIFELLGGAALSVRLLPELSPGLTLGVRAVLPPSWSLALHGFIWLPREAAVEGPRAETDGVSFGATQISAEVCRDLLRGSALSLAACGGALLGFRWLSATALGTEYNPARAYYSPLLGAEAKLRAGEGWFLRGGVTAMSSFPRERFVYRDHAGETRPLFTPAIVSGYTFLGLGAQL